MGRMLFASVSLPAPSSDGSNPLDGIFGPLKPLVSTALFYVELFAPLVMIVGVAGIVFGAVFGNKLHMTRGRGIILAVPYAFFLVGAAIIVTNWISGQYSVG